MDSIDKSFDFQQFMKIIQNRAHFVDKFIQIAINLEQVCEHLL